ncbi:MAG: hydrolase, partial [Candidatus Hydrogenedentes bacterium]|nr:hydrolase [Candidatus Hydrogenedentota bacterium]
LYYVPCDDLFGHDQDATVDGVHPNDLGFERMAGVIGPAVRRALR